MKTRLSRLWAVATALVLGTSGAIAVVGLTGTASAAVGGTGTGYLSTSGNQIVDSTGATVRLTGLNWFGMETDNKTFHGLWAGRDLEVDDRPHGPARATTRSGCRTPATRSSRARRRPASTPTPTRTSSACRRCRSSTRSSTYAGSKGMRIILDRHRPTAPGRPRSGTPRRCSEASEIADWQMLATRYAGNPTVVGADLFNEPHADGTEPNGTGACWGCGDTARDWRLAAERIGNASSPPTPNWLDHRRGRELPAAAATPNVWDNIPTTRCDWWGGNLTKAGAVPGAAEHGEQAGLLRARLRHLGLRPAALVQRPDLPEQPAGHLGPLLGLPRTSRTSRRCWSASSAAPWPNPLDTQWLTKLMPYMGTGVTGMSLHVLVVEPGLG